MSRPVPALLAGLLALSPLAGADLAVGKPAPALKVSRWVKGEPVPALVKGQTYVVEFWATWCGPCRQTIPHLTELARKYEGKITFIGVNVWERGVGAPMEAKVDAFVKDMGDKMAYRVARDTSGDFMAKSWMEAAQQNGIPCAFIVDATGTVAFVGNPMGPAFGKALEQIQAGTYDLKAAEAAFARDQALEREKARTQEAIQVALSKVQNPLAIAKRSKSPEKLIKTIDQVLVTYPVLKLTDLLDMRFAAQAHLTPDPCLAQFQQMQGPAGAQAAVAITKEAGLKPAFYEHALELLKPLLTDQPIMGEHLARASHFAGRKTDAVAYQQQLLAFARSRNAPGVVINEMEKDLKTYQTGL